MSKKIRWGVLGYARIARDHVIPAIQRTANGTFHALASRDAAKLDAARAQFNPPRLHPSYDALLRDPEVDAIYNPLPNSLHKEWSIKAAEHGKHILCEKPLALNTAEAREMFAAARANGVLLMEAFMYRYSSRTAAVRDVLRAGTLGEIRFIQSQFRFNLKWENDVRRVAALGGGSLYDVGVYPISFIGMILDEINRCAPGTGPRPESVVIQSVKENGCDELFSALLRYPGPVVAALHSGFSAQGRIFSEIIGTKGSLEIPLTFLGGAGELTLNCGTERHPIPVPECDRYCLQAEDFAAAILEKRAPLITPEETLRNLELLDRLYAAAG